MIGFENASKAFEEKIILSNVSLTFEEGSLTCITGGSGSGKTTLLRILAGLDTIDSGRVECGTVSYSFQEPRLFGQITALANASVSGKRERAKELLIRLGLADSLEKYPADLSGGMKQRVSVVRATVREAEVYLFDEPTAALDAESEKKCAAIIREELRGKTVIVATHSDLFREYADTVIMMKDGRIIYE